MADAPSLGDFFAKKQKKKIKASNLNVVATTKPDSTKKPKSKDAEAEGWQEEEVVAATMKVEVAGKLTREEEKKEEEDTAGHAWGSVKAKSESSQGLSDRKFPTLAKSVRTSTNINIDDGSQPTVNIATSKNVFAALENEEDDDGEVLRPKEIKPAMVQKKKGEREKVAIQREVDKYIPTKEVGKKEKKGEEDDEDEEEEDEDAEEQQQEEVEERKPEVKKKKKPEAAKEPEKEEEPEEEAAEDLQIVADLDAAKAKYTGRKKPFPSQPLPKSELEEEKENKPVVQSKKKKMAFMDFDDKKSKLQYADWD